MGYGITLHRFSRREDSSEQRARAIKKLMNRYVWDGRTISDDEFMDGYELHFPNGEAVEMSISGLSPEMGGDGCHFRLHGIGPAVCGFIYEVACAGNMIIFNEQGRDDEELTNPVAILVEPAQKEWATEIGYQNSVLCESGGHLEALLSGSHAAWLDYRRKVLARTDLD